MKQLFKSIIAFAAIVAMSFTVSARTSYRGFVDFDPTIAVSYSSVSPSDLKLDYKPADLSILFSTTHGVQINRHFFVGAGAGFRLGKTTTEPSEKGGGNIEDGSFELNLYVPVYLAARYDLNIVRKVSPFISFKAGYLYGISEYGEYNIPGSSGESLADSGFFFQPTVGVRIRLHHHVGLNRGLTLFPMKYKTEENSYSSNYSDIRASYTRYNLGLNIGIDF